MADFESGYNGFSSRFGDGTTANRRGSFGRFLEDTGGSKLGDFAGQMQSTFRPPTAVNGQEETAYGNAAEARNTEQWGQGLNGVTQRHGQLAQMGFNAHSQAQQVMQAKEMARLRAKSSQQGAMFGAIQSGIGMLGGIGGSIFSGGGSSGGSSLGFGGSSDPLGAGGAFWG